MTLLRTGFVLIAAAGLSACGSTKDFVLGIDNNEPPAELQSIESTVAIRTVWQRDVGSGGGRGAFGLTPVLYGGRIYAAEAGGDVTAYEAATGKEIWSTDIELRLSGGPGADSSLIVVGTENGEVIGLEATDGSTRWETRVSSEVLAAPRVVGDVVLVRSVDGKLTALESIDGVLRWTYDRTVPVLSLRGTAAPAISGDLVIAGFDSGRLVALDIATGQTVWERRVAVPRGRTELERLVDIDAEPQVVDGTIYVATFQGRVASIDAATGEVVWQRDMSSHAGVGVDDKQVLVSDAQSHVWSLDRNSSASLWRNKDLQFRAVTAPRSIGDYVVVGDLEGYTHWMQAADGRIVARVRAGGSAIYAPPLVLADMVFIYASDGTLTALRPGS
jgi:outer membrane protein assembly factor BamB